MQVTNPCYRQLPLSEVCVRESLLCSKMFTALAQISGSAQAWTSLTFPLQFFHWQNFVAGCNPQTLKTSPLRSKTSEKFFEDPFEQICRKETPHLTKLISLSLIHRDIM